MDVHFTSFFLSKLLVVGCGLCRKMKACVEINRNHNFIYNSTSYSYCCSLKPAVAAATTVADTTIDRKPLALSCLEGTEKPLSDRNVMAIALNPMYVRLIRKLPKSSHFYNSENWEQNEANVCNLQL